MSINDDVIDPISTEDVTEQKNFRAAEVFSQPVVKDIVWTLRFCSHVIPPEMQMLRSTSIALDLDN